MVWRDISPGSRDIGVDDFFQASVKKLSEALDKPSNSGSAAWLSGFDPKKPKKTYLGQGATWRASDATVVLTSVDLGANMVSAYALYVWEPGYKDYLSVKAADDKKRAEAQKQSADRSVGNL
jgi:hypothetical protein